MAYKFKVQYRTDLFPGRLESEVVADRLIVDQGSYIFVLDHAKQAPICIPVSVTLIVRPVGVVEEVEVP